MIWYDIIWFDMIWYDMIWFDMIWYDICMYIYMIHMYMLWIGRAPFTSNRFLKDDQNDRPNQLKRKCCDPPESRNQWEYRDLHNLDWTQPLLWLQRRKHLPQPWQHESTLFGTRHLRTTPCLGPTHRQAGSFGSCSNGWTHMSGM